MDYSCLTLSQDQVIKFPLTPGATLSFRDVGMKERGKGLEKEYVALHGINYRFSFTEKRQKGELNEKHEVVHLFIFQGFWYISCLGHPSTNNLVSNGF